MCHLSSFLQFLKLKRQAKNLMLYWILEAPLEEIKLQLNLLWLPWGKEKVACRCVITFSLESQLGVWGQSVRGSAHKGWCVWDSTALVHVPNDFEVKSPVQWWWQWPSMGVPRCAISSVQKHLVKIFPKHIKQSPLKKKFSWDRLRKLSPRLWATSWQTHF